MLFGSGSDGHGNLMTKTATENGTYTAAEEIDPETGEIFDPPKDGYSVFTVDLALDDKSVTLTTSQITGSQTAEFEYDPHDENPELEGYSLFTIDLSGVKDDIEDLQQQLDDLEDCRDAVIAKIQEYDPQFDPQSCQDIVDKWDEEQEEISDLEDEVESCHDCKDAVVAAIQQYVPSFTPDPTTCNIPDGVDDVYDQGREDEATENPPGVVVPDGVDPAPIALELNGAVTDDDIHASVQIVCRVSTNPDTYIEMTKLENPPYYTFYPFVKVSYIQDGAERIDYLPCVGDIGLNVNGEYGMITGYSISTSGIVTVNGVWHYCDATGWHDMSLSGQTGSQHLVGWGDTGHTQRITN